jgi:hypothetical protein
MFTDLQQDMLDRGIAGLQATEGFEAALGVSSRATGTLEAYSDLDLVVVARSEAQSEGMAERHSFPAGLGPLLAAFTAEHVSEPRLLIGLFGPPILPHVDLKFVALDDLDRFSERPVVRWWAHDVDVVKGRLGAVQIHTMGEEPAMVRGSSLAVGAPHRSQAGGRRIFRSYQRARLLS